MQTRLDFYTSYILEPLLCRRYICGGAIVDCSHVVTAAHCVKSLFPDEITVRIGDWDAAGDNEVEEEEWRDSEGLVA